MTNDNTALIAIVRWNIKTDIVEPFISWKVTNPAIVSTINTYNYRKYKYFNKHTAPSIKWLLLIRATKHQLITISLSESPKHLQVEIISWRLLPGIGNDYSNFTAAILMPCISDSNISCQGIVSSALISDFIWLIWYWQTNMSVIT